MGRFRFTCPPRVDSTPYEGKLKGPFDNSLFSVFLTLNVYLRSRVRVVIVTLFTDCGFTGFRKVKLHLYGIKLSTVFVFELK